MIYLCAFKSVCVVCVCGGGVLAKGIFFLSKSLAKGVSFFKKTPKNWHLGAKLSAFFF